VRITTQHRRHNEERIRAVMDQLLTGQIPPGGKCDITTLARHAAVDRTAFYAGRPYAHLREEFEQRLQTLRQAGQIPDPRDAQIDRLKQQISHLKKRLAQHDSTIGELTAFREQALSRLTAQHQEITQLRATANTNRNVRRLPANPTSTRPCS
jgi:septal ring factor EnvC (AmiA/AmiB activator)